MKKYIAPMVQITDLVETESLLDISDPNRHVQATTPDGKIDVMPSDSGTGGSGPSTTDGNLNYSKKFDSWSTWDE